jgi:hypothetical protein
MHERPHVERAMRMAGWWAMLVVVLLACSGLAFSREIEATVTGTGEDESSALANALAKAVAQVNGVNSSMSVSTGKVEVTGRGSETIRTRTQRP